MATIEERLERLLDQLENPSLSAGEIERLKQKIEYLRTLESGAHRGGQGYRPGSPAHLTIT